MKDSNRDDRKRSAQEPEQLYAFLDSAARPSVIHYYEAEPEDRTRKLLEKWLQEHDQHCEVSLRKIPNPLAHMSATTVLTTFIEITPKAHRQLEAPPSSAKYLLLLTPKKYRECLLGDLEEEFNTVLLPEYGPAMARVWYWEQVAVCLLEMLWEQFKRLGGLAALYERISR